MTVTPEELLYLSVIIGAENLWGVEDSFEGKEEEAIRGELPSIQSALVGKGLLEAHVDADFSLSENCRALLRHCKESDRILWFNSTVLESEGAVLRYFLKGDKVVRFYFREDALLHYSSQSLMRSELSDLFGDGGKAENTSSLVAGVARIRRMGSLSRQHFLLELKNCGCEDDLALLIADGLQGNSDFCSLLAYEQEKDGGKLTGKLVTLRFAGGSLLVTPGQGSVDSVCFTRLSREGLSRALDAILRSSEEVDAV